MSGRALCNWMGGWEERKYFIFKKAHTNLPYYLRYLSVQAGIYRIQLLINIIYE